LLQNSVLLLLSSVEKVRVRSMAVVAECYFGASCGTNLAQGSQ
jgi:hypothetical protein